MPRSTTLAPIPARPPLSKLSSSELLCQSHHCPLTRLTTEPFGNSLIICLSLQTIRYMDFRAIPPCLFTYTGNYSSTMRTALMTYGSMVQWTSDGLGDVWFVDNNYDYMTRCDTMRGRA